MEMVLKMLFFTLNNADIQLLEKKLIWRSYTAAKVLLTTKQIKLIDKKESAKSALDKKFETFVVHITTLETELAEMTIHFYEKLRF